ncbi:sensor histidine kinase [Pediococcus siamensis]|uniref:sensor histidine kinase n=1 Tax=Pediococcus siamensis TaxID=381829 RepID=UPI0039A1C252
MVYIPAKKLSDWFWLGMVAFFTLVYILVNEKPQWRRVTIPLELFIAGVFALFALNYYIIIFPGWQITVLLASRPKKYFYEFLGVYYILLFTSLIPFIQQNTATFQADFQNGLILFTLNLWFPISSPILSYVFSRSIFRQRQLRQTNRRLRALVQRNERERIARDLHDNLGQSFSMITIKTELAQKLLQKAPEQVSQELDDIAQTSRANLQMVRKIVNDLHQKSLSETLLEQSRHLAEVEVFLTTTGEAEALEWPTLIQSRFAAALTEAITNVIRHAHAHQVQIEFTTTAQIYQVKIQDDGRAQGQFQRAGSNGLQGMRARMLEGNGAFDLTHDRHGTRVTLTLPKE